MIYRSLGSTGIRVSVPAFGAGPVSGLMTGDNFAAQRAVVLRALELGINWFDTAPGYGNGRSEENLGRALADAAGDWHIATKVRILPGDFGDIRGAVLRSLDLSLARLRVSRVTLLQLHNGITENRGDEPNSITPADAIHVARAFEELTSAGRVNHLGLTGTGQPGALREVIRSRAFATIQAPYHILNPSFGQAMTLPEGETNYGNLMADCVANGVAVLAIRVFAGGALLDAEPSAHTRQTPYFPLDLYERDRTRARRIAEKIAGRISMPELALRFAITDPRVATAIAGIGSVQQLEDLVNFATQGPLPPEMLE